MFCGNCGKEIIGDTKFCPFCGAEQNAVVIPAASVPVSVSASAPNVSSVPDASVTTGLSASVSESTPAASTAMIEPAPVPGVPTPNTIPTSNIDMPDTSSPVVTVQAGGVDPRQTITIKNEEKHAPERKYSLKHIVMCLAAAAVMAVAAGVFAGLYFSVIFTK